MANAITRIYLKYPIRDNDNVLDVTDLVTTIDALTGGAANTTIAARMISVTNARDNKIVKIAADNIAGYEVIAGIVN